MLQRDIGDNFADAFNIERGDDILKAFDVRQNVGNDQHPGRRVREDDAGFGHQGIKYLFDFIRICMFQRENLCDDSVLRRNSLFLQAEFKVLSAGLHRRKDLDHVACLDRRKTVNFKNRLEDLVNVSHGDLSRRDQRDFSLHVVVDNEILSGQLTDKFNKNGNINVVKVYRDVSVAAGCHGRGRRRRSRFCRQSRRGILDRGLSGL